MSSSLVNDIKMPVPLKYNSAAMAKGVTKGGSRKPPGQENKILPAP
jgi:hypothetical protein